jgi:hypothetical protein
MMRRSFEFSSLKDLAMPNIRHLAALQQSSQRFSKSCASRLADPTSLAALRFL